MLFILSNEKETKQYDFTIGMLKIMDELKTFSLLQIVQVSIVCICLALKRDIDICQMKIFHPDDFVNEFD